MANPGKGSVYASQLHQSLCAPFMTLNEATDLTSDIMTMSSHGFQTAPESYVRHHAPQVDKVTHTTLQ